MESSRKEDHLTQGLTANGEFRVIAAQTTHSVEMVRGRLDLSPLATDALGRAMTGAVLLARLLEKQLSQQRVTLRFEGNGPIGTMVAEGTLTGDMRGYVANPQVGGTNLGVGDAVGHEGTLTVARGTPPAGRPYASQVQLVSGEVAKDLAHYLATSEQIASAVVLGVLNRPAGVSAAGGLIIQAFPHASAAAIERMENAIRKAPPFSTLLDRMPVEDAVRRILEGLGYRSLDSSFDVPLKFRCSCTRERALAPLQLFSRQEMAQMIQEGGSEVTCQYCGETYEFSAEDLLSLDAPPDA